MIRIALLLALVVSSAARADTSVAPDGAAAPPARCTYEDGPFWRAYQALTDDDRKKLLPYEEYRDASARYLLGSRSTASPRSTRVLDKRTHRVVRTFDVHALGLVEDRAGALVGVLTLDRRQIALIDAGTGKPRWRVTAPAGVRDESFSALVDGDRLILANYHRYATGASLTALDLGSGALRWSADVEQMNVGHSEYFNDVALEARGATVVMRGYEAAGCYVQSFDLASGRRLSSVMQRRW